MNRFFSLLVLFLLSASVQAQQVRTSHYQGECSECGVQETALGAHDFCALSAVASGGFNSSCSLRQTASGWTLLTRDPDGTYPGESQACSAVCLDFGATTAPTAPPVAPSVPTIAATWATQAGTYRGRNGQRFTFQCPAGGPLSTRLWGSSLYTDDSSICTAAVHAGVITVAGGGAVTIEIRPGASSYEASTRNGVASRSYGSWSGSFVVVGR